MLKLSLLVLTATFGKSQVSSVVTGIGSQHTCAIMSATSGLRCWGNNHAGELGDGTSEYIRQNDEFYTDLLTPPATDLILGVAQVLA